MHQNSYLSGQSWTDILREIKGIFSISFHFVRVIIVSFTDFMSLLYLKAQISYPFLSAFSA